MIHFCFRGLANCSRSFCRALLSWNSLGFCSSFSLSGFTDGSGLCPGKAPPELTLHLGTWLSLPLRGLQAALGHPSQPKLQSSVCSLLQNSKLHLRILYLQISEYTGLCLTKELPWILGLISGEAGDWIQIYKHSGHNIRPLQ